MAATGTEVPTYEQLKKLVESKAGGGGVPRAAVGGEHKYRHDIQR